MAYVTIEDIVDNLRQILEEQAPKRQAEMEARGLRSLPRVKTWAFDEWSPPEDGHSLMPLGLVTNDDPARTSERREQDTGETATFQTEVLLWYSTVGLSATEARRLGMRYADLIAYTILRNAKGQRPKDGTVLPGLFRHWPRQARIGETDLSDIGRVEVKVETIVDINESYATG